MTVASVRDDRTTQRLRLADGRTVGVAEYGEPAGRPVVVLQGTPSSRLMHHPDESIARDLQARLISIDRPGFGLSDFQPGRTLLDWPADVAAVMDQLGIDRFAVVGFSGGGPYTAACAYRIPSRLTCAAIVAGAGPVAAPGALDRMTRMRRMGLAVARTAPWLLRSLIWLLHHPRRDPARFFASFSDGFPPADRAIMAQPEIRAMMLANYAEAARQGVRGFAYEGILFSRPWGFRLEDIRMPVHLWHGEEDTSTPVAMARYVAGAIPDCRARFLPGEGHMLFFPRWREILGVLVAA